MIIPIKNNLEYYTDNVEYYKDDLLLQKYSIVILNYNRPHNIPIILKNLVQFKFIDKIIISNGKINTSIKYEHPKVILFDDSYNNKIHGLDLRFLRMLYCDTDNVIIMDDDMIIEQNELIKLLLEYEKNNNRIVGVNGRNIDEKLNYIMKEAYGELPIVLTKLMVCKKSLSYLFFYCKPLIEHIYKEGIPYGNGEDIFFSYVVSLFYDKLHLSLNGIKIKDIGNDLIAISSGPAHHLYRSKLCNYLYSNKELFKKHISKFKFPKNEEEEIIVKNKILKKEI